MVFHVALRNQPTTETVLHTVLIETEVILNSEPLGYISSDLGDPDPVTLNMLLMGWPNSSLPQEIYCASELLGRRRWCHGSYRIISGQPSFVITFQTSKPGKMGD